MKLVKNLVYKGWRYTGHQVAGKCEKCGLWRATAYEFIRPTTPYGEMWNGFVAPEEPMLLGSECVKTFLDETKDKLI